MSSLPIQAPPGGDADRGPALVALFWTESAVAILFIVSRFYARWTIRAVGKDDWMMLFTLLLFLVMAGFVTYLASIGGCRHLYYLSLAQRLNAVKYNWITQPWGIFAFATGKISVAFLILRIIGPNTFWRKYILYGIMVSVFIINGLGCILSFVQCNPPRALWTPDIIKPGTCWDPKVQSGYAMFLSIWNILVDVVLALLPATIFWNLKLSVYKRLSLCALLGIGLLAAICGAIKVKFLAGLNARSDLTWETFELFAWSGAESFIIIIAGSVPPLKPLYDRLSGARRNGGRTGYSRSQDKNSYALKRQYAKFSPTNSTSQSSRLVTAASTHPFPARREGSPKRKEIAAVTDIEVAARRTSLNGHEAV